MDWWFYEKYILTDGFDQNKVIGESWLKSSSSKNFIYFSVISISSINLSYGGVLKDGELTITQFAIILNDNRRK